MGSVPSKSAIQSSAGKVVDGGTEISPPTNIADSADRFDKVNDTLGDLYANSAVGARQVLGETPVSLSGIAAVSERFALRALQTLDHGVRKQPVKALLFAGTIGYLVGWAAIRG